MSPFSDSWTRRRSPPPRRRVLPLLLVFLAACAEESSPAGSPPAAEPPSSSATSPAQGPPTPSSDPAEELFAVAERLRKGTNEFHGHGALRALKRAREAATDDVTRLRVTIELANRYLRLGRVPAALEEVDAAFALADTVPGLDDDDPGRYRLRALAHLRQAEVENCIKRKNAECCLLPLAGGGLHTDPGPARAALADYRAVLARDPDLLEARWLLNLCAMALGEYPDGVEEELRIPPEVFASKAPFPRFRDVAQGAGVDDFDLSGGVLVDDLDGDGHLDLLTSTSDPEECLRLHLGTGGLSFRDATEAAGLTGQLGGLNLAGADVDEDGDRDVLVLRGAWLGLEGCIRNSLLENRGGTFADVTAAAGLAEPAYPSSSAAFADLDRDGDLDLYVANESRAAEDPALGDHACQLFLNDGRGRFTDRARELGVANDRLAKGVAAGDPDGDGDFDLYVSNFGPNRFYRNDGERFTDVARELGVEEPVRRSFATWFFDYDQDGRLDLFVAGFDARLRDVVADLLGRPHGGETPRLYRNTGAGFADVTAAAGLAHPWLAMGASYGDLDGDGFPDLCLGTGDIDLEALVPNVVLRNDGHGRFLDVTTAGGFGHLQKGHGVAFADLDGDGDQDLFVQLGGFYDGDRFHNALFENPGFGSRFLGLRLEAARPPRTAHGASVEVRVDGPDGPRTVYATAGATSSFGDAPTRLELGLGRATRIVSLTVRWRGGAEPQVLESLPLDAWVVVREGEGWEEEPSGS